MGSCVIVRNLYYVITVALPTAFEAFFLASSAKRLLDEIDTTKNGEHIDSALQLYIIALTQVPPTRRLINICLRLHYY